MKYKKYCFKLGNVLNGIADHLTSNKFTFTRTGPSFSIKTTKQNIDGLKKSIDSIVSDNFDGKQASKFCKYNYHDKHLFVQFKGRLV